MAKSVALGLAMLFVVLITAPTMVRSNSADHFVLYAHVRKGENTVRVAGSVPPSNFGDIEVFDFPATQSINSDEPPVARLQGIEVSASRDGTQKYYAFSIIFDQGKRKGSTVEVTGILKVAGATRNGELSVSGGTKNSRFSKGFAEVQTVREAPGTVTLLVNVYLKEYDD